MFLIQCTVVSPDPKCDIPITFIPLKLPEKYLCPIIPDSNILKPNILDKYLLETTP
jgi:hypothetical protein